MNIVHLNICFLIYFSLTNLLGQQSSCKELMKEAAIRAESNEHILAARLCDQIREKGCKIALFKNQLLIAEIYASVDSLDSAKKYLQKSINTASIDEIEKIKKSKKYSDFKRLINVELAFRKRKDQLIAHHQTLKIYVANREFIYSAIRINADKDTVASTKIIATSSGTGWGHPAASEQSEVVYTYLYTKQDSIQNIEELQKVVKLEFWIMQDTTGVIENEEEFWIHPMRNNQFYKTELAPFPTVIFPIDSKSIKSANSKIIILSDWGTYSPSVTDQRYFYEGVVEKEYSCTEKIECHRFSSYGHNSKFGISYLEYFFNEEYGFTEMNYLTYDNDIIKFELIDIND